MKREGEGESIRVGEKLKNPVRKKEKISAMRGCGRSGDALSDKSSNNPFGCLFCIHFARCATD